MEEEYNSYQLLLMFHRELLGVHGKGRDYSSPEITVRGCTFRYYFTQLQKDRIINTKGSHEMSFVESLYQYESDLDAYISNVTKESKFLNYWDWLKFRGIQIKFKENDLLHYSKR